MSTNKKQRRHAFSLTTCYCRVCGMALEDFLHDKQPCIEDTTNVIAISHTRSKQQLDSVNELIRTSYKDHNSPSK